MAGRKRLLGLVATTAIAIAGLLTPGAGASPPAPGQVSFAVSSLFPAFGPNVHDYVVRCHDLPVTVKAHVTSPWEAAIANHPYRSGDYSEGVQLGSGRAFTITVRDASDPQRLYRYHVRCLPDDFPKYTFTRSGPVSPRYFAVDESFDTPLETRYAMIFDDHGVPIWWDHAPAWGSRVLADGTVLWFDFSIRQWQIHRLDGSLVRVLDPAVQPANVHDLQLLGNGDYLIGANVRRSHVDTSAYGGSTDADVLSPELQEVDPSGNLVWDWKSQDHISLAETGRWWRWVINNGALGYDILHWNSIEPDGGSVIASFRHLDGVYKIDKATGDVVWKLGGTKTPESLEVKNDPRAYPLGAQHDARLLPDGTLTVFDNRSNLGNKVPRAVRYRIDEVTGTATLLQSISDRDVQVSGCCGSARRLGNGDWLIDWGLFNGIGGYEPGGQRTFRLTFDSTISYRAEPVAPGAVSAPDLRDAMDAMCSPGC